MTAPSCQHNRKLEITAYRDRSATPPYEHYRLGLFCDECEDHNEEGAADLPETWRTTNPLHVLIELQ